jgi:hypothetical protein
MMNILIISEISTKNAKFNFNLICTHLHNTILKKKSFTISKRFLP